MKLSQEQKQAAIYSALRVLFGCSCASPCSCSYDWYTVATFDDVVIVRKGGPSTSLFSYPYSFDAEGKATLGEPTAVEVVYQALSEAAHGSCVLGPMVESEAKGSKPGSRWLVCVISEGLSKNRTFYSAEVLREAVPMYEGKPVFWGHTRRGDGGEPDPRDTGGFLSDAKFTTVGLESSGAAGRGAVIATLNATDPGLRERLLEAHEAGNTRLYGLSHAAYVVESKGIHSDGKAVRRVVQIKDVESVDVVSFPSAGGRVVRLVAGLSSPVVATEEDLVMFEKKLAKLKESYPALAAKLTATPTEAEVDALLLEALTHVAAAPPAPAPAATAVQESVTFQGDQAKQIALLLRENVISKALEGRTLPKAMASQVREELGSRPTLTVEEATAVVDRAVKTAAAIIDETRGIVGSGYGLTIESGKDEAEKILDGCDAFFLSQASEAVKAEYKKITGHAVPAEVFSGVKEMYTAITGDHRVTGQLTESSSRHLARFTKLTESIGTATLANIYRSTLNRALLAEYRATDFSVRWRRVCSQVVGVNDFRNQERVRWGSFADLSIVNQFGTYPTMADPSDELISYAPQKRGGIVGISREAIKNDDTGFVRQIPQKLALSAARTLHNFVFNLILTNPTLDDSVALFAASTSRGFSSAGNIITTALSKANVSVARQRLLRVKDRDSNTVLGLSPKILIVPPELEELSIQLTSNPVVTTTNQNATEPNYVAQKYGLNEYIVLETMSDQNDFFILADPTLQNTIEMGFVDNQQEPVLFIQDMENVGSMFSNDTMNWKARHEYGGDVVDWRGMIGGIVP